MSTATTMRSATPLRRRQQCAQAIQRAANALDVFGNAERERSSQHAVQERGDQLVLPVEVEEDEAVAEPGSRCNGSHGKTVEPLAQRNLVRRPEDLLPAPRLGCLPSGHAPPHYY